MCEIFNALTPREHAEKYVQKSEVWSKLANFTLDVSNLHNICIFNYAKCQIVNNISAGSIFHINNHCLQN